MDSFANNTTNKFEERQMFWIDPRIFVRLIRLLVSGARLEKSVVRVEHLSSQYLEPFSRQTTGINTLFVIESNAEFAVFDLFPRFSLQV